MAQMMGLRRTLFETAADMSTGEALPGVCRRCHRTQLVKATARRFPIGVPLALVVAAAALVAMTWNTGATAGDASSLLLALEILLTIGAWATLFARKTRPMCPACDLGQEMPEPLPAARPVPEPSEAPRPSPGASVYQLADRRPRVTKPPQAEMDLDLSFLDDELDATNSRK